MSSPSHGGGADPTVGSRRCRCCIGEAPGRGASRRLPFHMPLRKIRRNVAAQNTSVSCRGGTNESAGRGTGRHSPETTLIRDLCSGRATRRNTEKPGKGMKLAGRPKHRFRGGAEKAPTTKPTASRLSKRVAACGRRRGKGGGGDGKRLRRALRGKPDVRAAPTAVHAVKNTHRAFQECRVMQRWRTSKPPKKRMVALSYNLPVAGTRRTTTETVSRKP